MTTQAERKAIEKYQKEHITRVVIKLNDNTDKDLIDRYKALKSLKKQIGSEVKEAWREYLQK